MRWDQVAIRDWLEPPVCLCPCRAAVRMLAKTSVGQPNLEQTAGLELLSVMRKVGLARGIRPL